MSKQMSPVDALAAILAARRTTKKKLPPPKPQRFKAPAQMPTVYTPPAS